MAGMLEPVLGFLSGSLGQWVAGAQPTPGGPKETLLPRYLIAARHRGNHSLLRPQTRARWPPSKPSLLAPQIQPAESD